MPDPVPGYLFAPCGVNCLACYVHLKKKKPCDGCLGSDENKPERCRTCAIKACAADRGLTRCLECSDFPCTRIKNLDKSYRTRYNVSIIANSMTVMTDGPDRFQENQKVLWRCSCGGIVSQHDGFCSECGIQRG